MKLSGGGGGGGRGRGPGERRGGIAGERLYYLFLTIAFCKTKQVNKEGVAAL